MCIEFVNIISINCGVVSDMSTYLKENVKDAENEFKRMAKQLGCSDFDIELACEDGYFESDDGQKSICIRWSEVFQNIG